MKTEKLEVENVSSATVRAIEELANTQFEGKVNLALREIVEKSLLLYGKIEDLEIRIQDMESFFYAHKDLFEKMILSTQGKRKARKRVDGSWR